MEMHECSDNSSHALAVYLTLARASERRQRPLVRDRLMLLSGIEAARADFYQLSQYCRQVILEHNARHFVGRWQSVAKALADEEFLRLAANVRRRYPLERAEQMLTKLGIDIANERVTYFDDLEYAAAILGIDKAKISDARDALIWSQLDFRISRFDVSPDCGSKTLTNAIRLNLFELLFLAVTKL